MATPQPHSLREELRDRHDRADRCLRSRYGMSFRAFKIIKGTTQLVGMAAGVYAMFLGADPLLTFAMMAFIWAGPEAVEHVLETSESD